MRVIRWKNSATGVESLNITAAGIYFPVGKTDSSFKLKLSMASAGQTASVDTVRDSSGSRTGYGAMNVSGTTETKLGAVVSFATGIIVTAISGTLNAILDDEIAITSWPEVSLGRFHAIEDLVAYCYGSNPPVGLRASVNGAQYTYSAGAGWREAGKASPNQYRTNRSLCGYMDTVAGAGYRDRTYRATIASASPFVAVRIALRNESAAAITWDGPIYVGATAVSAGNQNAVAWKPVTWGGGSSATIPAATGAKASRNCVNGRIYSDWIELKSVARTDGGSLPLVAISGYATTAMGSIPMQVGTSQLSDEWRDISNSDVGGYTIESRSAAGNAANSATFDGTLTIYSNPFFEVEFMHAAPAITLYGIGDSIMQGDNQSSFSITSPVHFAAKSLRADGLAVQFSNHGFSSQASASFLGRLHGILVAASAPAVVVYHAWTPNETVGLAKFDMAAAVCWDNMIRAYQDARAAGVGLFCVCTGLPSSMTGDGEAVRVGFNSRLRTWAAANAVVLIDNDAVLRDPAAPNTIKAEYAADAIHPSLDGDRTLGANIYNVLAPIVATMFA